MQLRLPVQEKFAPFRHFYFSRSYYSTVKNLGLLDLSEDCTYD